MIFPLVKAIPFGSWDFGMDPFSLAEVSRRGLIGNDRTAFLTKRAGAAEFVDAMSKEALHPGDIPIHAIAIGATEYYGFNRNGDGFNEDTCRKQAHTFVSKPLRDFRKSAHNGARFFENHVNQDPANSFGYTKAAYFNPRMKRIELLIIGNGTKEAAERNGGHVMADDLLQALATKKAVGVSMACKLPFDVCDICGNRARNRHEYCTEKTCKASDGSLGLGCRDNLTKLGATGRQQGVENPGAMFFDISRVSRPADRTAYAHRADYLSKAASWAAGSRVIGGAELAETYPGLLVPASRSPLLA